MFFAGMPPTLLSGTIEHKIPFPPLNNASRIVQSTHDRKCLCKAAAGAQGARWSSGKEAEETMTMWKGDFWFGLFSAAWEDEEGAVGCPGACYVLRMGEDRKQARSKALSVVYAR